MAKAIKLKIQNEEKIIALADISGILQAKVQPITFQDEFGNEIAAYDNSSGVVVAIPGGDAHKIPSRIYPNPLYKGAVADEAAIMPTDTAGDFVDNTDTSTEWINALDNPTIASYFAGSSATTYIVEWNWNTAFGVAFPTSVTTMTLTPRIGSPIIVTADGSTGELIWDSGVLYTDPTGWDQSEVDAFNAWFEGTGGVIATTADPTNFGYWIGDIQTLGYIDNGLPIGTTPHEFTNPAQDLVDVDRNIKGLINDLEAKVDSQDASLEARKLEVWTGTKAEFLALGILKEGWMYVTTDEGAA
jgi:hypothetical protein